MEEPRLYTLNQLQELFNFHVRRSLVQKETRDNRSELQRQLEMIASTEQEIIKLREEMNSKDEQLKKDIETDRQEEVEYRATLQRQIQDTVFKVSSFGKLINNSNHLVKQMQ
mmetsp:Transcript_14911/g.14500  ORF Transcript_14911/g.14500 Transcript_14911/m.14500 type:complete len:112 (-) Transcript_14911:924-1259(-)